MASIHGGQILARALKAEGTDVVFALTGGHILPILDGCVAEGIRVIDVRHEQTAAHAAEAYTRLTGRLGVAAVTAGPGVTDALTGLATADASSTPMLLLGGRHMVRRELAGQLQEMDHMPLVRPVTRWAGTVSTLDRIPEYVATAARHAFAGRGGPVFLDVPMDILFDMAPEDAIIWPAGYRLRSRGGADTETLGAIAAAIRGAARPMIFAGAASRGGDNRLSDLAERMDAPTFTNGPARGSLCHDHPLLGVWTRSEIMGSADLVLALGVDWDFRTGHGSKLADGTRVVHVDADPTRIGWNVGIEIGVRADPMTVASQLADVDLGAVDPGWVSEFQTAERDAWRRADEQAASDQIPIDPNRFAREVAAFFGDDAIVAVDGGDIVSTTARWLAISHPGHLLEPGPFGTLGTGPGYAIAAKVVHPDRHVGIVFGDGAFGFNGMEYDTMVRLGLPIVGVVGNDGAWSNVKTLQRMFYPERIVASDLGIRRYERMVEGLGGHGDWVEDPAGIVPALERARASGLPALVNVRIAESMRASSNYGV